MSDPTREAAQTDEALREAVAAAMLQSDMDDGNEGLYVDDYDRLADAAIAAFLASPPTGYFSAAGAADATLAALSAAGFEVLPTALVDAVLALLPWVSLYNKQADALADEIRAYREQVTP